MVSVYVGRRPALFYPADVLGAIGLLTRALLAAGTLMRQPRLGTADGAFAQW